MNAWLPEVFEATVENSPVPWFCKDLEGRFQRCNKAYCSRFHLDEKAVLGKTLLDLVSPDLAVFHAAHERYLLEDPSCTSNSYYDSRDGLTYRLDKVFDGAGNLRGLAGTLLDSAAIQVVAGENVNGVLSFRQVFENMLDGVALHRIILDPSGKPVDYEFLEVNPAFGMILGRPAAEIVGKRVMELLPGTEPYWVETYGNIALHGGTVHLEHEASKLGRRYEVVAFSPAKGQFVCIVRDVTDLFRALAAAQEKSRLLQTVLDGIPDIVGVMTVDHSIMLYNKAGLEYFNMSPEQLAGKKCYEIIGRKYLCDVCATDSAIRQERPICLEKYIPEIDTWFEVRAIPVMDGENRIVMVVETLRDIADRKRSEKAMLLATNKAQEASKAKTWFMACLSHEIRTPLNGLLGIMQLLAGTPLTDDQREMCRMAKSCGESLLAVLNDLLDFSNIEQGNILFDEIDFDLREAIEHVAEIYAVRAREKGLDFSLLIEPSGDYHVRGDPGRLQQVFHNLLSNAVKFTSSGHVRVLASMDIDKNGRKQYRFEVQDTGTGIPAERVPLLFQPFSQIQDSIYTRTVGGMGLGLVIVKRLLERMGGAIGVDSSPDSGSRFWFTAVFKHARSIGGEESEHVPGRQSRRILVIDRSSAHCQSLALLLAHLGCSAEFVSNFSEAAGLLRRATARYDILFVDCTTCTRDQARELSHTGNGIEMVLLTPAGVNLDGWPAECCRLTQPIRYKSLVEALSTINRKQQPVPAAVSAENACRILLAEDNVINQFVTKATLEQGGHVCDVVGDGQEAVTLLETVPYSLVLMDCSMPRMDGFAATRIIRSPDSRVLDHSIPIIALTAHAYKEDREKCFAAGMDDYLSKPILSRDLYAVISRWGKKTAAGPAVPAVPAASVAPVEDSVPAAWAADAFLRRVGNNRGIARRVIEMFQHNLPLQLQQMKSVPLDREKLAFLAHTIKGAALNLGCEGISQAACEIERNLEAAPEVQTALIARLEQAFEGFKKQALETLTHMGIADENTDR